MPIKLEIAAVLIALAYRAAPGPVLTEAARQGLTSGFRAALAVELGSVAGDAFWVIITLAGAAALVEVSGFQLAAGAAGGVFLIWLGIRALQSARHEHRIASAGSLVERAFATGAAISVASPYALPFWLGVSSSLPGYGISAEGGLGYAAFLVTFLLTCLAFALAAAAAIAWGRRLLSPRFFFAVDLVCGLVLLGIGLNLLGFSLTHAIS